MGEKHKSKKIKIKKESFWKSVSIILGILLITSLYFNFSGKPASKVGSEISINKAADKAVDYINNYLLEPGTTATLESKEDRGNLYNLKIDIGGREYDSYVTKDGKLLFPNVIDLEETPLQEPTVPGEAQEIEVNIDDASSKGSEDAKVTIIEYASFSCGWCNRVRPTLDQILETYPNDVKIVYKHFNRGGTDSKTGQAVECASEHGKFWEMHDIIFDKGSSGDLKEYAGEIGLDVDSFNQCLDSGKYASRIESDTSEARSFGISGTPGFMVNGRLVSGAQPFEVFKGIIDAELAK